MSSDSFSSDMPYELTNPEYERMCRLIIKGFQDTLKNFLTDLHSPENGKVLSRTTFSPSLSSSRLSPVVLAAKEGRIGIIQFFIDSFKDLIDINYGSSFEYPDLYLLDMQLVKKMKTNRVTAVNAACVGGFTEIVKILVRAGGSMNLPDDFGYTPLGNASRYGREDTVEFLLRRGADISRRTHDGYAPIHLAAMHGQAGIVKMMLSKMLSPLYPKSGRTEHDEVPCPLYLAAARGWQPVVDAFTSVPSCPPECKLDALLLLGAAARLFSKEVTDKNKKGVADLWIEARRMKDKREYLMAVVPPVAAYHNKQELVTEASIKGLFESPNFIVDSLYQCLIIHERCMGFVNSFDWVFNVGIKLFQNTQYEDAEQLWQRAMQMHYEFAKKKITSDNPRPPDLSGCIAYMIQFSLAIEEMVHNDYTPMWFEYINYALQQLKLVILLGLQSNYGILNISTILKLYRILLQIFSCWITKEIGEKALSSSKNLSSKQVYSDALERSGQSFVDTANVLTHSNTIKLALYPAAPITHHSEHFQNVKRLPSLLIALLDWGGRDTIDDVDNDGNRPLHIAARLTKKALRDVLIPILLSHGAHQDALNSEGKTAEELFKEAHPKDSNPFPTLVPKLTCLSCRALLASSVPFNTSEISGDLMAFIKLHADVSISVSLRW